MCFDLTDKLSEEILSAMEDQKTVYVVDAENCSLVEAVNGISADDEHFYALPVWDSAAGFMLREQFTDSLYIPVVREELQDVLHSGRGVFRNFKEILKKYPEVDRKWHLFKNKEMHKMVNKWYNALRETWGLEKLDQEPEDIEDLVCKDFVFREYNPLLDKDYILHQANAAAGDMDAEWPEEVRNAFADLWKRQFDYAEKNSITGFTCLTPSDEFAGCITFTSCPSSAKKTVILTCLFVQKNFRGLGIGKELFSMCLTSLRKKGFQWVILANTIIPDIMIPLLDRSGFKRIGSGFIADLFEKTDVL